MGFQRVRCWLGCSHPSSHMSVARDANAAMRAGCVAATVLLLLLASACSLIADFNGLQGGETDAGALNEGGGVPDATALNEGGDASDAAAMSDGGDASDSSDAPVDGSSGFCAS